MWVPWLLDIDIYILYSYSQMSLSTWKGCMGSGSGGGPIDVGEGSSGVGP